MAYLEFEVWTDGLDNLPYRLREASTKAEHEIAVRVEKDTEPFVPAGTRTLVNDTKVVGNLIIYPAPTSRFLYFGKLMIDPNTGSSWAPYGANKVVTGKDLQYRKDVHSRATSHWFEVSKAQNLEKWVRVAGRAYGENI